MHTCGSCKTVTPHAIQARLRLLASIYFNYLYRLGLYSRINCRGGGGGSRIFRQSLIPILHTSGQTMLKCISRFFFYYYHYIQTKIIIFLYSFTLLFFFISFIFFFSFLSLFSFLLFFITCFFSSSHQTMIKNSMPFKNYKRFTN